MAQRYNTVVIGAGPGGYVAALHLANAKQKVALIENKHLGGTCLNVGCIPTKALLHDSELVAGIRNGAARGVNVAKMTIDFAKMMQRKNQVIQRLQGGVRSLVKSRKIDLFEGTGKLTGTNQVEVTTADGQTQTLETDNIIIATGSAPRVPGVFPADRTKVMTSDEILSINELPKKLLIVGGGYIGCEFATLFAELGVEVVVVEMLDRLLPMQDQDLSKALAKVFKNAGITVHTSTGVEKLEVTRKGVQATLSGDVTVPADLALVCTGRGPVSGDMGLEAAGVESDNGFVLIDEQCRTNVANIYAIGDVTGKVQLAHVASRQAAVAANTIVGRQDSEDYAIVPSAVYTHPEIGMVGLSEDQAREQGLKFKTAAFSMQASGMATAYGETEGFAKLIVGEEFGEILGAHLMCPHAADAIHEIAVLMKSECTVHELVATIHGHPTFSEALAEVAEKITGHPIHG